MEAHIFEFGNGPKFFYFFIFLNIRAWGRGNMALMMKDGESIWKIVKWFPKYQVTLGETFKDLIKYLPLIENLYSTFVTFVTYEHTYDLK